MSRGEIPLEARRRTFEFDGVLRKGAGGGTLEFVPSETFPVELAKRGFAKPSRVEQMKMAWHDTGFAFIDELAAKKYQRPTLKRSSTPATTGSIASTFGELTGLGYRLGSVDALIRQRDHGVNGEFIRELASLGLKGLSADDLVRARDHGVGPEFVNQMAAAGISRSSLTQMIAMRDHGITPRRTPARARAVERLIALHDHGQ